MVLSWLVQAGQQQALPVASVAPPIATQCFMLSNMFDPTNETHPLWHQVTFFLYLKLD